MNATWTRRAIGCSSSVCVRAKSPRPTSSGVFVVCSISSSSSTAVEALLATTRDLAALEQLVKLGGDLCETVLAGHRGLAGIRSIQFRRLFRLAAHSWLL